MNLIWEIIQDDIDRIKLFVSHNRNTFVEKRELKNVDRQGILLNKESFLKAMTMCLLTSQQRSGPTSPVSIFLQKIPFPISLESISQLTNLELYIRESLLKNGLNRYINKIPSFFNRNFNLLLSTNWSILAEIENKLLVDPTLEKEREIADKISDTFFGFGPKQARNLLQSLGLTKYEIPIDSRITNWLTNFGFPVTLSPAALQDKGYYHFVSDGIQVLCERANIYPCILDATIFSSYDNGQWSEENIVF